MDKRMSESERALGASQSFGQTGRTGAHRACSGSVQGEG